MSHKRLVLYLQTSSLITLPLTIAPLLSVTIRQAQPHLTLLAMMIHTMATAVQIAAL